MHHRTLWLSTSYIIICAFFSILNSFKPFKTLHSWHDPITIYCFQHLAQVCFSTVPSITSYSSTVSHMSGIKLSALPYCQKYSVQNLYVWPHRLWRLWRYEPDWTNSLSAVSWTLGFVAVQETWVGQDGDQLHHRQGNAATNLGRCGAGCWHRGSEFLAWDWSCVLHMMLFKQIAGYIMACSRTTVKWLPG